MHKSINVLVFAEKEPKSERTRGSESEWNMQTEGDERGKAERLRVQTKVSLQPAHNALLSSSCAFRYLSLYSLPLLSHSPSNRLLLSTLILFVLSMLYIVEVTSGRNVLLPGVQGEIYRLSFLALCSPCTSRGLLSTTTSFCARLPCTVSVFIRFGTVWTIYNANDIVVVKCRQKRFLLSRLYIN